MSTVNKAMILGRLGADPEVRYSQQGKAVANLSIATTETYNDKQSGEKKEKTEWHRVVLFNRPAEIAGEYLVKGSLVYIEGTIQTRKWQDRDGNDKYTTEIVGRDLKMIGGKGESGQQKQPESRAHPAAPGPGYDEGQFDDDIPF